MTIKAWIITLNPESENVKKMQSKLFQEGIESFIFNGVDGRKITPKLKNCESISLYGALKKRRAPLSNSEIGCYLSHYRLIKQSYENNESHVLILEDDVVINDNIFHLIKSIKELDENYHFVRLMALRIRKRSVIKNLTKKYKLTRPKRGSLGAQGYILNRKGMELIIKYGNKLSMPIDNFYDSFFTYGLNCYTVEPHAIYELDNKSSVKKQFHQEKGYLITIIYHLNKIIRSILRITYNLKNHKELKNCEFPESIIGKSPRLRK